MKDNNSIQLPHLNKDEEYIVSKRKIQSKPKFTMIGNKMKSIEIIADFGKPEAFTFKILQSNRDWESNIVTYSTKNLSNTDKVIFSKGYKLLSNADLVKRIKKGAESIYMFNPNFIIPNNYEPAVEKWNELTK